MYQIEKIGGNFWLVDYSDAHAAPGSVPTAPAMFRIGTGRPAPVPYTAFRGRRRLVK